MMLRKRLNLKEKLGSSVKKVEKVAGDDTVASDELLKVEATDSASASPQSSWGEGEKEIFELQLEQLEEQLTASWMKNQDLEEELRQLQGHDLPRKYKEEKKENKRLREQLSHLEVLLSSKEKSTTSSEPLDSWETVEREDSLEDEAHQIETHLQSNEVVNPNDGIDQREDSVSPESETETPVTWRGRIMNLLFDRMGDFTDEQPEHEHSALALYNHPLTYKKLKKSFKRFGKGFKLCLRAVTWIRPIISWKNPFLTFVMFVVCMYTIWMDCVLPLLILLCIGKLTLNYFYATGLAVQFGFQMEQPVEEEVTESKMHLVLNIARHVQNKLAFVADNIEKIKNLFLWHEPKATRKLMKILLWAFFLTAFFPGRLVFKLVVGMDDKQLCGLLIAFGACVKIFIINLIYRAFPKVACRYGSISRLYKGLLTDQQLQDYYELSDKDRDIRRHRLLGDTQDNRRESSTPSVSPEDVSFCRRFVIDPPEARIKPLDEGVACQIVDRSQSVFQMLKSGKLYLTQSFLVFERLFRKHKSRLRTDDYILIPLQDIASVKKCKPFAFLPGKGMAIEVAVADQEKPYVFGALLSRHEVYQTILETGAAAGLRWGNPANN